MLLCTVDSAVTSDARRPAFESRNRQLVLNLYLLLIARTKDEKLEKDAGKLPIYKAQNNIFNNAPT